MLASWLREKQSFLSLALGRLEVLEIMCKWWVGGIKKFARRLKVESGALSMADLREEQEEKEGNVA